MLAARNEKAIGRLSVPWICTGSRKNSGVCPYLYDGKWNLNRSVAVSAMHGQDDDYGIERRSSATKIDNGSCSSGCGVRQPMTPRLACRDYWWDLTLRSIIRDDQLWGRGHQLDCQQ